MKTARSSPVIHVLTVDVEDWYTGIPVRRDSIGRSEYRLRMEMDGLLRILDDDGVKGTFFWLGELAEMYPGLVRTVHESGHMIGCHGWTHDFYESVSRPTLRSSLTDAKNLLQDISGSEVVSHRAPYFSISEENLDILDLLVELGFRIDSSIFPVRNWRYGFPGFPDGIRKVATGAGRLWLAPVSVRRIGGMSIPVSGGAYFRIYPYTMSSSNLRWLEHRERPCVFYLHPWELDPGQPRPGFDMRAKLTHYANLRSCARKFRRLLSEFRFGPLEVTVERLESEPHPQETAVIPNGPAAVGPDGIRPPGGLDHLSLRRSDVQVECLRRTDPSGKVVLDIGTRECSVLERIVRNLDPGTVIGLDLETKGFDSAVRHGDILLIQADAEEMPFRSGSVDLAVCTSVYKHVVDVRAMLHECRRVLRPEGILSLIDVTPVGIFLGRLSGHLERGSIRRRSSLADLCRILSESGFEVVDRKHFAALPCRMPGQGRLEQLLGKAGLGGLMLYQSVVGIRSPDWSPVRQDGYSTTTNLEATEPPSSEASTK